MTSIKKLHKYHKKTGKRIVIGRQKKLTVHKGWRK